VAAETNLEPNAFPLRRSNPRVARDSQLAVHDEGMAIRSPPDHLAGTDLETEERKEGEEVDRRRGDRYHAKGEDRDQARGSALGLKPNGRRKQNGV
jgi:hypothetical protein